MASQSKDKESSAGTFRFAVRALKHRNYRLFFSGQSISLIGTWMTRVAMSWLVYRLTDSALLLGVVGFAGQFPAFLLAPFAGVWVDRWDRQRVLVVTQVLSMLQSALMAYFALTHIITVWDIIALSLFQGSINAFDMPARQAFVIQMVEDRADLPNAIALNSSMVNGSRLLGPSIAGILIAAVGEGYCFLIDAISYIGVLASLLAMREIAARTTGARQKLTTEFREGLRYAMGSTTIRSIIILLALISFAGMPYMVLMPIVAGTVLHGGPHTLGILMAASGVGALTSAMMLATRKSVVGLGKVIPAMAVLFGFGLLGLSFSRTLWLSMIFMACAGAGMMQEMAASNTILQTIVDDDKRGRVMSFYLMAFVGMAPIGSLVEGWAANNWGAPETLFGGGILCVLGGAWFATKLPELRKQIRPIYRRLGIIPELAEAIQTTSALQTPPEE